MVEAISQTTDNSQEQGERRNTVDPVALDLMGIPVHCVEARGAFEFLAREIAADRKVLGLHANVLGANLAARLPWLKELYQRAQLVLCDGDGVRWGFKILGMAPPPKIPYNVWMWQLAGWSAERGLSMFLLGGRENVAKRAADKLTARFPTLRILGTHHGYFDKSGAENDEVVAKINRLNPDILIVCLGMPIQERWVLENEHELNANVLLTAGAALEFVAGDVRMAPRWMIRMHTEWLFRFLREPVRLFRRYVFGNPRFIGRVVVERVRRSLG